MTEFVGHSHDRHAAADQDRRIRGAQVARATSLSEAGSLRRGPPPAPPPVLPAALGPRFASWPGGPAEASERPVPRSRPRGRIRGRVAGSPTAPRTPVLSTVRRRRVAAWSRSTSRRGKHRGPHPGNPRPGEPQRTDAARPSAQTARGGTSGNPPASSLVFPGARADVSQTQAAELGDDPGVELDRVVRQHRARLPDRPWASRGQRQRTASLPRSRRTPSRIRGYAAGPPGSWSRQDESTERRSRE
jgi:hypothetical protein